MSYYIRFDIVRSSHPVSVRCSAVGIFLGKHLHQSNKFAGQHATIKKETLTQVFFMNNAKFFKASFYRTPMNDCLVWYIILNYSSPGSYQIFLLKEEPGVFLVAFKIWERRVKNLVWVLLVILGLRTNKSKTFHHE